MDLDARGIPGVSIVTTGFTDVVAVHTQALGFDPAIVYVPHPIQNRTAEELDRIADNVIDEALGKLSAAD